MLALVRNQSGIVDNYDLRVEGMPDDWWSIYPGTVYLVPFGSGGTYEQEVEVHLHPPRSARGRGARCGTCSVVARLQGAGPRGRAPRRWRCTSLPYIETATTLRPQRKKGRRKADFDVTVTNKANAPVLVALEGEDPDGELQFGFNRPPQEIPAGAAVKSTHAVRPPKQIWIGRAAGPPARGQDDHRRGGGRARRRRAAGRRGAEPAARLPPAQGAAAPPRAATCRASIPRASTSRSCTRRTRRSARAASSCACRKLQAPQVAGPADEADAARRRRPDLKLPGRGGGAPAPAAPLLPTQGVFRQKPWIPWWAVPLLIAIIALLLLLYKLLAAEGRRAATSSGQQSAFEAEQKLTEADLKLDPNQKKQLDAKVKPGTIIGQTPAAGDEGQEGRRR